MRPVRVGYIAPVCAAYMAQPPLRAARTDFPQVVHAEPPNNAQMAFSEVAHSGCTEQEQQEQMATQGMALVGISPIARIPSWFRYGGERGTGAR